MAKGDLLSDRDKALPDLRRRELDQVVPLAAPIRDRALRMNPDIERERAADADIRRIIRQVDPPGPGARLAALGPAGAAIAAAVRAAAVSAASAIVERKCRAPPARVAAILGLALPFLAILFAKATRFKSA